MVLTPAVLSETEGYKPGEKKSVAEYAQLDAEDESLARWKASLGIAANQATAGDPSKPKVGMRLGESG
jgi:Rho GDP-dissociation inhibitor